MKYACALISNSDVASYIDSIQIQIQIQIHMQLLRLQYFGTTLCDLNRSCANQHVEPFISVLRNNQ